MENLEVPTPYEPSWVDRFIDWHDLAANPGFAQLSWWRFPSVAARYHAGSSLGNAPSDCHLGNSTDPSQIAPLLTASEGDLSLTSVRPGQAPAAPSWILAELACRS